MKFSDITGNDVTTLTEAPMGFMKTLGTAAKAINPFSLSGRSQAQGQFKTGVSANQIYGDYYKWLGSTGQQPDTDNVVSFLQQNGYGPQAISAAQTKFPPAPKAEPTPPADNRVEPTLNNPADQTQPPANGKMTPDQIAAAKQRSKSNTARLQNNPKKFKNSKVGAQHNKLITKPDGSQQMVPIREGMLYEGEPLTKDQLSAVFTAVAQSGAVPQQSTSAGSDDTATDGQQATDQQPRNSGRSSQLPNRLSPDDILWYYAKLDKPDERLKVKNGIPEVDKQLDKTSQQID